MWAIVKFIEDVEEREGPLMFRDIMAGRCGLPVSRPVLKAHVVSALEAMIRRTAFKLFVLVRLIFQSLMIKTVLQ
jgi:hypothetical protein